MKKITIVAVTIALLLGAIGFSHNSSADQPRHKHSTLMLGYRATYRLEHSADGSVYMTEDDFVVDLVSGSPDAPKISIGTRYAVVNAYLRDEGYRVAGQIIFGLEKWEN
jgi:hypothetical protein